MSTSYYQPSGRVSPVAPPIAVLLALAIAPGAWAYAWLTIHLVFLLNVCATFAYSLYLGCLVRQVVAAGRMRNPRWAGRAGTVFALLGWYCQWAAWLALTGKGSALPSAFERFLALLADPVAMGRCMAGLLGEGKLEAAGWQVTSVGLLVFWLLELWMLLMLPASMGRERAEEPFCEVSNRWAEELAVPGEFESVDAVTIAAQLEADPAQAGQLLEPMAGTGASRCARVKLYRCHASDSYLSVTNVTRTMNAKGKVEEKEEPALHFLRLPGIDPDDLLRQWDVQAVPDEVGEGGQPEGGDAAAARDVAPELEAALAHLQAERFDAALAAAVPGVGSGQLEMRADANRICALACSRLERWQDARGYWQALEQDEPSAHNALQLATSSVMAGELADGIQALEQARERNDVGGEMPPVAILTGFVTALVKMGHLREAMPYVDAIRQAYLSAGTTDSTLLYMRGMPFFSAFLEKSLPVVRATLDPRKAQRWYASMLPRLDENGQAELQAWLESSFEGAAGQGAPG